MSQKLASLQERFMRRKSLWICFTLVHVVFFAGLSSLIFSGGVLSDINIYRQWAFQGINDGIWQGISTDWVYPIGAMVPMLVSAVLGSELYQLVWFFLFTGLNAAAVAVISKPGTPTRYASAYWWLLITGLLGPVAVGRVDGLTAPLVIAALLLLASRPIIASALLAFATWMKVWPAAVILAVLVTWRRRATLVLIGAAVSIVMAGIVIAGGGLSHLLSFVGAQGARGMQMEAPFTTPGLWQAILGGSDAFIYEDKLINTREVRGALGEPVAALMMPLLALAAIAVVVLLFWAMRRGADASQLLIAGSLALVSAFIVFNKVGSPQFMLWLGAVVAVGVAWEGRSWITPAVLMLIIAPLTTLVYPLFYAALYNDLNVGVALLLTVRNILLLVLFAWSLLRIVRLTKAGSSDLPTATEARPGTAP